MKSIAEEYIVYKTKGPKGLYYIGVHIVNKGNYDDGYIGCGIKGAIKTMSSKTRSRLGLAIYLTGYKHWKREIIEIFTNRDQAYRKEAELVTSKLILSDPKCLNSVPGGNISPSAKTRYNYPHIVALYNHEGHLVEVFNSRKAAASFFNISTASFNSSYKKNKGYERIVLDKFRYRFFRNEGEVSNSIPTLKRLNNYRPIGLYDAITGKLIDVGYTAISLARKYNLSPSAVQRCGHNYYSTIGKKYKAMYIEDVTNPPEIYSKMLNTQTSLS